MSTHIGREVAFGAAVESSRGTAETTADKWFKKTTVSLLPEVEKVVDDSSFGRLEDAEEVRTVREWFGGSIDGVLHADAIGYPLNNLYGTVTTEETAVDSGVFEHTFELGQTITHPTLSFFIADQVKKEVYNGGVISTLSIEATTDDYVRYSMEVLARASASHTDTVSYDTEYDFIGKDITVKVADTEAGLVGATAVPMKSLNINIDAGAISDWVFGDTTPEHYNGAFGIEFDFTKNYVDNTFEALFKSDNAKYVQVSIVGDTVLPETNAPELTFTFYKCKVTDYDIDDAADELREENVTMKALFNVSDTKQSQVFLRNLTASY